MTRAAATPVPSVSKAIAILRLLGRGGEPMGVTAIARATGMGPSSAFNLVRTLVAEGLVDFDRTTKSYRIGMGSIDFARMALRSDGVVVAARPVMDALAEHYDAAIGLWRAASGERLLLLALAESEEATRIHMAAGQRQPMGAGATGRAFLAEWCVEEPGLRQAYAAIRWPGKIDEDAYVGQIETARRMGYALDNQWLNLGIVTAAAIVPEAGGTARYALSASMFAGSVDARRLNEIGQEIKKSADMIAGLGAK